MYKRYDKEFKLEMARLVIQENRGYAELAEEYGVPAATISRWVNNVPREWRNG